jgi:hypothetical protein
MSDAKDTAKDSAATSKSPEGNEKKTKKGDSDAAPTSQATPPIIRRKKAKPPAEAEAVEPAAPQATAAEAPPEGKEGSAKPEPPAEAAETSPPAAAEKQDEPKPDAGAVAESTPEEGVSPNVKAAAKMGPAARLAAEAAAKRAALGEDAPADDETGSEVQVSATDLDAEIRATEAPRRRARKRRAVKTEVSETDEAAQPASADDEKDASPKRAAKERSDGDQGRRKRRRNRGKKGEGDRRPRRGDGSGQSQGDIKGVGETSRGRIYRQDLAPDVAAAKAEAERKAAEEERKRKEKNAQDKITLILHPAPKASQGSKRRKKRKRPKTAKEALQEKTAARSRDAGSASASEKAPAKDVKLKDGWLKADSGSAEKALKDAGTAAEALVKAWLDDNNASALARAAQLDNLPSKARKAARRALGALKARGVEVPELEEKASVLTTEGPEAPVAMFIPPDASGSTFFSISQRQPGGRYHVVDIVLRSNAGVVHANSAKLAGKHIKGWLSRVEKQYGAKPVQVPIEWARHEIAEGRKLNDETSQLVPLGFDSCAPLLEPVPDAEPDHPLADLMAEEPNKAEIEKAIVDSDELHAEPEFSSWLPDRAALDELLAKVGERVGPDGVNDSNAVDEAIKAEVAAATDRWFTPEKRNTLADGMCECAISLRARHGDDVARRVVAVSKAVREAGLITSPPSEIPFLLHFFQKAVAYLVQQNQGQLRVPIPAQP